MNEPADRQHATRSEALQQLCKTTRSAPYTLRNGHAVGVDGGVLPPGAKVWVPQLPAAVRRMRQVDGFVEGMGEISIAGSLLRRVDH